MMDIDKILKMEEQINKYDSIMNRKKYLEDLGFSLNRVEINNTLYFVEA